MSDKAKEILITGNGYIAQNLDLEATHLLHKDCDLTNWGQVKNFDWDGDYIIHTAHDGIYGKDVQGSVEKNIQMFINMRRRWPKAKLISFGSGAMYDRSKPVIHAHTRQVFYPKDLYGLSKRLTLNLSDVTLIPFGLWGDTRYIKAVKDSIRLNEPLTIYQDTLFSWVNVEDLTSAVKTAMVSGQGAYNLCGFDMSLSEIAKNFGVKEIIYLKQGMGNEYTGMPNSISTTKCIFNTPKVSLDSLSEMQSTGL